MIYVKLGILRLLFTNVLFQLLIFESFPISFLDPVLSDGQNSSNLDLVLDKEPDHHLQHNSITIQSAALNFDRNRNHSILPSDKTNALVLLRRY